jgi:hypothetical protein
MPQEFIRTDNHVLVPVSLITLIRKASDGSKKVLIETKTETHMVSYTDFESIDKLLEPVVPMISAQPGWILLQYITDSDRDDDVIQVDIIGWRYDNIRIWPIHMDRSLYEIVDDDLNIANIIEYVMSPSGHVYSPSDCYWDNYDAWLETMKKEEHKSKRKA